MGFVVRLGAGPGDREADQRAPPNLGTISEMQLIGNREKYMLRYSSEVKRHSKVSSTKFTRQGWALSDFLGTKLLLIELSKSPLCSVRHGVPIIHSVV